MTKIIIAFFFAAAAAAAIYFTVMYVMIPAIREAVTYVVSSLLVERVIPVIGTLIDYYLLIPFVLPLFLINIVTDAVEIFAGTKPVYQAQVSVLEPTGSADIYTQPEYLVWKTEYGLTPPYPASEEAGKETPTLVAVWKDHIQNNESIVVRESAERNDPRRYALNVREFIQTKGIAFDSDEFYRILSNALVMGIPIGVYADGSLPDVPAPPVIMTPEEAEKAVTSQSKISPPFFPYSDPKADNGIFLIFESETMSGWYTELLLPEDGYDEQGNQISVQRTLSEEEQAAVDALYQNEELNANVFRDLFYKTVNKGHAYPNYLADRLEYLRQNPSDINRAELGSLVSMMFVQRDALEAIMDDYVFSPANHATALHKDRCGAWVDKYIKGEGGYIGSASYPPQWESSMPFFYRWNTDGSYPEQWQGEVLGKSWNDYADFFMSYNFAQNTGQPGEGEEGEDVEKKEKTLEISETEYKYRGINISLYCFFPGNVLWVDFIQNNADIVADLTLPVNDIARYTPLVSELIERNGFVLGEEPAEDENGEGEQSAETALGTETQSDSSLGESEIDESELDEGETDEGEPVEDELPSNVIVPGSDAFYKLLADTINDGAIEVGNVPVNRWLPQDLGYTPNTEHTSLASRKTDTLKVSDGQPIINYLLENQLVRSVFSAITIISIALCIAFSIYAVVRSMGDLNVKKPVGKVMGMVGKSLLTLLIIPVFAVSAVSLTGVLLRSVSEVMAGGNEEDGITVSGALFAAGVVPEAALIKGEPSFFNSFRPQKVSSRDIFGNSVSNSNMFDNSYLTMSFYMPKLRANYNQFLSEAERMARYNELVEKYRNTRISIDQIDEIRKDFEVLKLYFSMRMNIVAIGSWIVLILLIMTLFVFTRRIFDIVMLYVVSPFFAATIPLDEGVVFKRWREKFVGACVSGIGTLLTFYLFIIMLPLIWNSDLELTDNAFSSTILKLLLMIGGAYTVYKSHTMITELVAPEAASADKESLGVIGRQVVDKPLAKIESTIKENVSVQGAMKVAGTAGKAFGAVKEIANLAGGVGDALSSVGDVASSVGEVAGNVAEAAGEAAGAVGEAVSDVAEGVGEAAGSIAEASHAFRGGGASSYESESASLGAASSAATTQGDGSLVSSEKKRQ